MNVTIGQYIPGNSLLHRLDPRIKIIAMFVLVLTIFIIPVSLEMMHMIWMGGLFLLTVLLVFLSGIPIGKVMQGMKAIVFLLTFTFVLQLFTVRTGSELFNQPMHLSWSSIAALLILIIFYQWSKVRVKFRTIYFFSFVFLVFFIQYILPYAPIFQYDFMIYSDGLSRAVFIFLRIISVMMIASLLTFTTSTIEMNDGLESVLKPLKYIGVPVATISMMISLTLRNIPTLLGEADKIMKAQTARGADFKEANLKEKIVQVVALLMPFFTIAFSRSEDLSDAMEVRGYVIGAPRTKLDVYKIKVKDIVALVFVIAILIGYVVHRFAL